jgi:hypothetical protein
MPGWMRMHEASLITKTWLKSEGQMAEWSKALS